MSTSRGTPTPMNVARALAPLTVLDERSQPVTLGPLWRAGPIVLVFVRQFG